MIGEFNTMGYRVAITGSTVGEVFDPWNEMRYGILKNGKTVSNDHIAGTYESLGSPDTPPVL